MKTPEAVLHDKQGTSERGLGQFVAARDAIYKIRGIDEVSLVARLDAHLTGIQEVKGSMLQSRNILLRRFVMNHSLPTADSSRAVISFWRKDVHLVLVNRLCFSLPRKSMVWLTDYLNMTIVVDWDVKQQNRQMR